MTDDEYTEAIRARGHENVRAEHTSTFEVTADEYLTPAGDCIVGIEADRVPADFNAEFAEACRDPTARIVAGLTIGERTEHIVGRGHSDLTFESDRSAVFRTSDYVDERTVMVRADAAAGDLDRTFVRALANGAPLTVTLRVERTR